MGRTALIQIPTPDFITFYIGKEDRPLEQTLWLSDAFTEQEGSSSLELKTRVININHDKKHKILKDCRILGKYSQEGMKEGIRTGISVLVSTCQDFEKSREETRTCLLRNYTLSDKDADAYMDEFWK